MTTARSEAVATTLMRPNFYRDSYRLLLRVAIFQATLLGFMLLMMIGLVVFYQPRERFFAISFDGHLRPIAPLDMPHRSTAEITTWMQAKGGVILSWDEAEDGPLEAHLEQLKPFFINEESWQAFQAAEGGTLAAFGYRDLVTRGGFTRINAEMQDVRIRREFAENGFYRWQGSAVAQVTFSGSRTKPPASGGYPIAFTVIRQRDLSAPEGVALLALQPGGG